VKKAEKVGKVIMRKVATSRKKQRLMIDNGKQRSISVCKCLIVMFNRLYYFYSTKHDFLSFKFL